MKKEAKELNRYFLVSYHGTRETVVQTKREYEEMLEKINKYNSNEKNKYIYGNISCESKEDGLHIISHVYNRLSSKMTISEILEYTTKYTKEEIATIYSSDTEMQEGYLADINVAYYQDYNKNDIDKKYERRIKYVPVMYRDDKKYLSLEYIYKCIKYHADKNDFLFFRGLASELCFNKKVDKEIEEMYSVCDKCEHQGYDPYEMYATAKLLIKKYVTQRAKDGSAKRDDEGNIITSKRRVLDVGAYVKYDGDMSLKNSPLKYNEGPDRYKKEEIKRDLENQKILKLQKEGKYEYEQLSLF